MFNVLEVESRASLLEQGLARSSGREWRRGPGKPSAVRKDSFLKHSLLSPHATVSSFLLIPYVFLNGCLFTACSIEQAVEGP